MAMIHRIHRFLIIGFMLIFPSTPSWAGDETVQKTPIVVGDTLVPVAPVKIGADPTELDDSDGVVDVLMELWDSIFTEDNRQPIVANPLKLENLSKQRRGPVTKGRSTGLPVPRFVSLGNNANLRTGPGQRYPIQWVLRTPYLPLEIVGEYDEWRQVRDADGAKGWVFGPILKSKRYLSVMVDEAALYREKKYESIIIARLGKNVIVRPDKCDQYWCFVETVNVDGGYQGWIRRAHVWGIYQNESLSD